MRLFPIAFSLFFTVIICFSLSVDASDSNKTDTTQTSIFRKNELNYGFVFQGFPEREEMRSDISFEYEELMMNSFKFRLTEKCWNYTVFKQESWGYMLEGGLFGGKGNTIDSTSQAMIEADNNVFGMLGRISGDYINRYYYDSRNYTLVSINGRARYDYYRRNSEGTLVDSNFVSSTYTDCSDKSRFRIAFNARAGWGIGRLKNINHYVAAKRLLEIYYPKRVFSEEEAEQLKNEIARIKHSRNRKEGYSVEQELKQLSDFFTREMLLEEPSAPQYDWMLTEFSPRYDGTRFELGPFFNYFNYEPDFIYGGYIKYENNKYRNPEWNRELCINVNYNKYKNHDWVFMETILGWSYYPGLKSECSFGIKYIPAFDIRDWNDIGPVRHNIIPYFKYFTQVNPRYRIDIALAYRIAPNEQYMLPGPEFSVSVYKSRY